MIPRHILSPEAFGSPKTFLYHRRMISIAPYVRLILLEVSFLFIKLKIIMQKKSKRVVAGLLAVGVITTGFAVLPEVALAANPVVICVDRVGFDVYLAGGSFSRSSCRSREVTIPLSGATGVKGPNGDQGAQGPTGLTGATGTPGTNGTNGVNGLDGAPGVDGITPNGSLAMSGGTTDNFTNTSQFYPINAVTSNTTATTSANQRTLHVAGTLSNITVSIGTSSNSSTYVFYLIKNGISVGSCSVTAGSGNSGCSITPSPTSFVNGDIVIMKGIRTVGAVSKSATWTSTYTYGSPVIN